MARLALLATPARAVNNLSCLVNVSLLQRKMQLSFFYFLSGHFISHGKTFKAQLVVLSSYRLSFCAGQVAKLDSGNNLSGWAIPARTECGKKKNPGAKFCKCAEMRWTVLKVWKQSRVCFLFIVECDQQGKLSLAHDSLCWKKIDSLLFFDPPKYINQNTKNAHWNFSRKQTEQTGNTKRTTFSK